MKVWVIMLNDDLYSIGCKGGRPGYRSKKRAEDTIAAVMKSDREYITQRTRAGLKAAPVIAARGTLEAMEIYPID